MEPKKIQSHWNEVWKPVDFGSPTKTCLYEISNYGRIKSINKKTEVERLIKGVKVNRNLIVLNMVLKDGVRGYAYVHKFVAEHFVEKPSEDHTYILHIDQDRSNNKWNNLKWATEEEWKAYTLTKESFKKGREKREKSYKLNETKVKLIKERLRKGKTKIKIIARQFGVSEKQIRRIKSGENWSDVDPD